MIRIKFYKARRIYLLLLIISALLSSCTKNLQKEIDVYRNNFNDNNITKINNIRQANYNGSGVLGRFGNDGFELALENLPDHDLAQVSFDLYIHDNWKGNSPTGINDSCDIWIMNFDGNNDLYTTFTNNLCGAAACSYQSYPNGFPFQHNPAFANARKTGLSGFSGGSSSMYKIVRTVYHSSQTFKLGCYAQLYSHLKSTDPLAEASWSVDNLVVKVIRFRE